MSFFDYNRDEKKDWKDNMREYYLYEKFKEDLEKQEQEQKEEELKNMQSDFDTQYHNTFSSTSFAKNEKKPPVKDNRADKIAGTIVTILGFTYIFADLGVWKTIFSILGLNSLYMELVFFFSQFPFF